MDAVEVRQRARRVERTQSQMGAPLTAVGPATGTPVPLTIVIPTLNEAAQLPDLLGSLHWADEVIVADGGSTDGTGAIARAQGATVLERAGSTIAAQRNRAIAAARNAWVLALDADERISDTLRQELPCVLRDPTHSAYRVRRQNFFLGRERRRGRWGRDWQVRLFTRERRFLLDRVHERLEPVRDAGTLHATLRHAPYRNLRHQLDKSPPPVAVLAGLPRIRQLARRRVRTPHLYAHSVLLLSQVRLSLGAGPRRTARLLKAKGRCPL